MRKDKLTVWLSQLERGCEATAQISVNIFKEINSDLGIAQPELTGCLIPWAKYGKLLNTALTVRARGLIHAPRKKAGSS